MDIKLILRSLKVITVIIALKCASIACVPCSHALKWTYGSKMWPVYTHLDTVLHFCSKFCLLIESWHLYLAITHTPPSFVCLVIHSHCERERTRDRDSKRESTSERQWVRESERESTREREREKAWVRETKSEREMRDSESVRERATEREREKERNESDRERQSARERAQERQWKREKERESACVFLLS